MNIPNIASNKKIVGKDLDALVRSSKLLLLNDHGIAQSSAIFSKDGSYRFLGREPWSTRSTYNIENERVCIRGTDQDQCFQVLSNSRGDFFVVYDRDQQKTLTRAKFAKIEEE